MSSNGQEDHVSMGANAATKCYKVLNNTITVLGIEAMVAAQALDFRRPTKSSDAIESLHTLIRSSVPYINKDVYLHDQIINSRNVIEGML